MPTGQKHLVKCRCVLPQFKRSENPIQHQFIVFSVIDDNDSVKPKFAQCPNCGIVHRVIELSKSEIIGGRELMKSIMTIEDIKQSLPEKLASILEANEADLPTWEAAQFIIENKQWGNFVVMTSDRDGDIRQGKYVRILGETLFKVESYCREEVINRE